MSSLWQRIEPLLARVEKPARYIGMEQGAVWPRHRPDDVSWLLVYPDTYEVGLPNQGLQILYEILNERDDAAAERSYSPWVDMEALMRQRRGRRLSRSHHTPWVDMEALMRQRRVPLFSVDTHRRADAFDVIAFNLSAELVYTNVLNCIDLAGVPVRAADRGP